MLYALMGLGLALITGILNIPNFAHGALFAVGAYLLVTAISLSEISGSACSSRRSASRSSGCSSSTPGSAGSTPQGTTTSCSSPSASR